jgi:hypothetical protein
MLPDVHGLHVGDMDEEKRNSTIEGRKGAYQMRAMIRKKSARMMLLGGVMAVVFAFFASSASAGMAEAKKWVDSEFQPSTLTKAQQMKEMEWFIKAAKPYKGMEIKIVSETIPTHEYESKVLAKAFYDITGIKVTHDLIQEGDVIEKLQTPWGWGGIFFPLPTSTTPISSAPTGVTRMWFAWKIL